MATRHRIKKAYRREQVVRPDPQREAPRSSHLQLVRRAINRLPFSCTVFFTDENGQTIKCGQFVKLQEEY